MRRITARSMWSNGAHVFVGRVDKRYRLQFCSVHYNVPGKSAPRTDTILPGESPSLQKIPEYATPLLQPLLLQFSHFYPAYEKLLELLCMHLLPKLHEDGHSIDIGLSERMDVLDQQSTKHLPETADYHALLSISSFAKVGCPDVIYAQGSQENVEDFVANVKPMQWLPLKVRSVEPTDLAIDFEKVGEVVEGMRRCGRDKYITETGIGNSVLQ
ncbi:uncharacterized protein BJ212DRAFT_1304006 [Suillus subaureus]|uniref:Uncharacterized protein n=1 Tax=Suillus subaureus TaxID=48587 RepID=A0A9P7J6F6_9AGAM|nr:uncharacterized protein BJ212DRAFT_1304006 [Suillus subaureus]KAG1805547.1 hypothetical protein BJ212DRAFT_1304006 [Suillus subaureus]